MLTENNSITCVLTSAKLDATGHRWLTELASFNFKIKYRPGRHNTDADALSRLPIKEDWKITSEAVQAICSSMIPKCYVESLAVYPDVIPDDDLVATDISSMVD